MNQIAGYVPLSGNLTLRGGGGEGLQSEAVNGQGWH